MACILQDTTCLIDDATSLFDQLRPVSNELDSIDVLWDKFVILAICERYPDAGLTYLAKGLPESFLTQVTAEIVILG